MSLPASYNELSKDDVSNSVGHVDFISTLLEDVLWRIFLVIVSRTEDAPSRTYEYDAPSGWDNRPVNVTWRCAQVCHRWRELLLNAPSLWGRLIDLDAFSSMGSRQKDEIMRRTGESPLIVKGGVFIARAHERDYFMFLLQHHWPRVESLRIRISGTRLLEKSAWDILYQPAPRLRNIHVHSRDGFDLAPSQADMHLFENEAPQLEAFGSWKLNVMLQPELRWLSVIRRLDISYSQKMTISDWLEALKQMPRLESLSLLKALPDPSDASTSVSVHLPYLTKIDLTGGLRACTVLMEQIFPSKQCRLSLNTFDEEEPIRTPDMALARKTLSRYLRNFLESYRPATFALALYSIGFRLADKAPLRDVDEASIFVDISSTSIQSSDTIFSLLQALSSCDSNCVKTLELDAAASFGQWDQAAITLLQNLENVESIVADLSALKVLGDEAAGHSTIFPNLRKIKALKSMGYEDIFQYGEELLPLLLAKKMSGMPIESLDLAGWGGVEGLEVFDAVEGLKIFYYEDIVLREYHCGAGKVQYSREGDNAT
ncbi:hypothetical protein CVT26_001371 [Gymnopilus dilepis]|uniref:F-box domain-containing protein n=1 Tax=Gymnopilus dilepis TaxID=231916 RepID=A0A409YUK3_9AGAR|nr:hypothetical protein CVT26_001371 [Gymnopilus dilepis]